MSYSTIKQLVMGGNGASKITTLEPAKATAILDGLDLSQLAQKQAETDTKNSTAEAVFLWAEKLLRMVSRDENPDTVALLKARMAAATDGVVSAVGGPGRLEARPDFTQVEHHNLLSSDQSIGACALCIQDRGFRGSQARFENGFELVVSGGEQCIYFENADPVDHPYYDRQTSLVRITLPTDTEAAELSLLESQRLRQRTMGLQLNLEDFKVNRKLTNATLSSNGEHRLFTEQAIYRDGPIAGVEKPGPALGHRWTSALSTEGDQWLFTLEPEEASQEATAEFIVTAAVEDIFLNLCWSDEQDPFTVFQVFSFFSRQLGEEAVYNTLFWEDMPLDQKIVKFKRLALERWVHKHRNEHQALYDQLEIPPDTVLLSYAKVTKAAVPEVMEPPKIDKFSLDELFPLTLSTSGDVAETWLEGGFKTDMPLLYESCHTSPEEVEIERETELDLKVEDFQLRVHTTNGELQLAGQNQPFTGFENGKAFSQQQFCPPDDIQRPAGAEVEGMVCCGNLQFADGESCLDFNLVPTDKSQTAQAKLVFTTTVSQLFGRLLPNEMVGQKPLTQPQVLGFFRRQLGASAVEALDPSLPLADKVTQLKQQAIQAWVTRQREAQPELYERLGLTDSQTLLLGYGEITKPVKTSS